MATLREIKRRITGIKNTQQITKAMKMVAAAKMRRAQDRMLAARPYAAKIKELIQNLVANAASSDSPLLKERSLEKITLVVVTSDRGLCGAFNGNVIKSALAEMDQYRGKDIELVPIGRKGYDFFHKRNFDIRCHYINFFNYLEYTHAADITQFLVNDFLEERTSAVHLIYNEFKSVARQNLVCESLLPLKLEETEESRPIDYLYEPKQEVLLEALLPKYLKTRVWRALLESFASEQAARMIAMENATDNANELVQALTLQYNKARQASITKEILEIVGGANALKQAS